MTIQNKVSSILTQYQGLSIQSKVIRKATKKYVLKISPVHGLECFCPLKASDREVEKFILDHAKWIQSKQSTLDQVTRYQEEGLGHPSCIKLQYFGKDVAVEHKLACRSPRIHGSSDRIIIHSPNNPDLIRSLLSQYLKQTAEEYFKPHIEALSHTSGLPFTSLKIGLAKQRWGSCRSDNVIRLNAMLLFLPKVLVTHVMLHELCHTVHQNHSRSFWSLLESLDSNTSENKKYLRNTDYYYQYIPPYFWV